jgi:hypothetical protein
MVIELVTALGLTLFVALMVNVDGPAVVGVPDNEPEAAFNDKPAGNEPEFTANVGAGLPVAAKV